MKWKPSNSRPLSIDEIICSHGINWKRSIKLINKKEKRKGKIFGSAGGKVVLESFDSHNIFLIER